MARFVVVAGTDTGVGKTVVTAGLARALIAAGHRTVAVKPVESGCATEAPSREEDGVELAAATGQREPTAALVRLREPLTPALAAERQGIAMDVDALADRIAELAIGADVVLVEGAGGLLSPMSWTHDVTHLAHRLDAQVLLVGADRLGTLNHVHLTVQVLLDTWLLPLGIVLSAPATADASTGTNRAALERRLDRYGDVARRIVTIPRLGPSSREASRHLGEVVEWIRAAS